MRHDTERNDTQHNDTHLTLLANNFLSLPGACTIKLYTAVIYGFS